MKWDCEDKINQTIRESEQRIADYIDMLHLQAESKFLVKTKNDTVKVINSKLIGDFLRKRGYSMNYILDKAVMVKGFTCVYVSGDYVEVWHDKTNNDKSIFIHESLLTGLPITLNYMERI